MTYYDRRRLVEALEPCLVRTFWPVLRVSSFCPTWRVGFNGTNPRVVGRIWAVHAPTKLSLGFNVGYRSLNPSFVVMPENEAEWEQAIATAFLRLSNEMNENGVVWLVPA